jgi:hypothetical protein
MANERKDLAAELVKGRAATEKDPLTRFPSDDQRGHKILIIVVVGWSKGREVDLRLSVGNGECIGQKPCFFSVNQAFRHNRPCESMALAPPNIHGISTFIDGGLETK